MEGQKKKKSNTKDAWVESQSTHSCVTCCAPKKLKVVLGNKWPSLNERILVAPFKWEAAKSPVELHQAGCNSLAPLLLPSERKMRLRQHGCEGPPPSDTPSYNPNAVQPRRSCSRRAAIHRLPYVPETRPMQSSIRVSIPARPRTP
jgi:hypothetical protein